MGRSNIRAMLLSVIIIGILFMGSLTAQAEAVDVEKNWDEENITLVDLMQKENASRGIEVILEQCF